MIELLLSEGRRLLSEHGVENAVQEASWIVSELAGIPVSELPVTEKPIPPELRDRIFRALRRRAAGEPLQYVLGNEYFGEDRFLVGPGCLIPRPETWKMVELLAGRLPEKASVCEIGTGSGAVAVSLARKRPDLRIYAGDISNEALKWAEKNRRAYHADSVVLGHGAFFDPFPELRFDAVAANLPYIPFEDRASLPESVREFEPPEALFASDSGMALMREAIRRMPRFLNPGACAIFEMGSEQTGTMAGVFRSVFPDVEILCDLFGRERFVFGYSFQGE